MKLKKLLALLLALVMVFSLAACGSSDRDDEDKKEEEKTEESAKPEDTGDKGDKKDDAPAAKLDYTLLVDAYEDVCSNPTLKGFATLAGGTLFYDEMYKRFLGQLEREGMTEDELFGQARVATVTDSSAEALSADEIAAYQDKLAKLAAMAQDELDSINAMTEEDLQELADERGITLDEAKQLVADVIDSLTSLIDKLDGTKIDAAQRVTITLESEDGESISSDPCFFVCGDKWFTDAVITEYMPCG